MRSSWHDARAPRALGGVTIAVAAVSLSACATSPATSAAGAPAPSMSASPPTPDPRVGLRPGRADSATNKVLERAGETLWNFRLVSSSPPSEKLNGGDNTDIAFRHQELIQGNYNGWTVWDIANPAKPTQRIVYVCPGSQSDVSLFKNLLFVSGESASGRLDCGTEGVADSVSHERLRGIRIFDVTDFTHPRYLTNVQTCRGSHTHTVVTDPRDSANVYVYVSGASGVRSEKELPGCSAMTPEEDPNSSLFRIEVIQVPLAHPEQAKIVTSPRIFQDLAPAPKNMTRAELDSAEARERRRITPDRPSTPGEGVRPTLADRGPQQCHDITAFPAIGLAAGACRGYGLLLDIRDVANPKRVGAVSDSNFSFWHSATFNNDGSKVLFTDEWGGGSQPRCRSTDKYEWGADAIFTLSGTQMTFHSYFKMPAVQTPQENCVAHNGSLIPVPGRDLMVQGWYQGGVSLFDWTDADHPKEIGFFDRGPLSHRLTLAGSWSAYWYNGYIYSSEIARGLDVLELVPNALLSQNEIDAAKTVRFDYLNTQDQQRFVWPPSFVVARAYLDQLARTNGYSGVSAVRQELDRSEKLSGDARRAALSALATKLHQDAAAATDQKKVHALAAAVEQLAGMR